MPNWSPDINTKKYKKPLLKTGAFLLNNISQPISGELIFSKNKKNLLDS
jgi:hypothetical protein